MARIIGRIRGFFMGERKTEPPPLVESDRSKVDFMQAVTTSFLQTQSPRSQVFILSSQPDLPKGNE